MNKKAIIIGLCVMLPILPVITAAAAVSSLFGWLVQDEDDDEEHNNLVDICVNNYPITSDFKGEGWEWVPQCQKDIQSMRTSGVFADGTTTTNFSGDGKEIVDYAKKFIGYPYKTGGTDPNTGADASGFTKYVFGHFGVTLNSKPQDQAKNGEHLNSESDAKSGDLMIWEDHVAIYEDGGKIIHAKNASTGIREETATVSAGSGNFLGYYRVQGVNGNNPAPQNEDPEDKLSIIAEEKASAVLLAYPYVLSDNGELYATGGVDWVKYANCFTEDDFTVEGYDPKTDASWANLKAAGFKEIADDDIDMIIDIANEIHGKIESNATIEGEVTIEDLKGYWSGEVPKGIGSGADALWNKIDEEGKGHFQVYQGKDRHQCTDVSHWLFWKTYKTDWDGGGNGNQCVTNICKTFTKNGRRTPDGYYFVESTTPEPGAVFSTGFGKGKTGHTGFVSEVHDGYYLYIDGNIEYGKPPYIHKGIRINAKRSIAESMGQYTYAVPRK